jgi:predicted Zn-ribbon and HTH transcriptional regulator
MNWYALRRVLTRELGDEARAHQAAEMARVRPVPIPDIMSIASVTTAELIAANRAGEGAALTLAEIVEKYIPKATSEMDHAARFERRFGVLRTEPWYETLVYQHEVVSDYDDEGRAQSDIERLLIDRAKSLNLTLPPARCWECDADLPDEYARDGAQCVDCRADDVEEQTQRERVRQAEEARLAAMPPEEREVYEQRQREAARIYTAGLINRNVQ